MRVKVVIRLCSIWLFRKLFKIYVFFKDESDIIYG